MSRIFLGDFINFHFHNFSSFPSTLIVEFLDFHLHNHEIFSSMTFVNLLSIIGVCSNFHVTLMFVPSYLFLNTPLHALTFQFIAVFVIGAVNAGLIPQAGQIEQEIIPGVATDTLVKGPSTRTQILGPDGSQITADAPGGAIISNDHVVIPVVATPLVAAPVVARTFIAEPLVAAAPVVASVAPLTPVVAPVAAVSAPVVAKALESAPAVAADDGQYVPDNTEKLYDDGSYKGEGEENYS